MMHRVLFTAALGACAVALATHAARPAAAADTAAIFAKHKSYMGWAFGDGTLKSVRTTVVSEAAAPAPTPQPGATPDPLGLPHTKQIEMRRELLYRSITERYALEVASEGFTGSVFWNANDNGQTVTVRGNAARYRLTTNLIDAEAMAETPSSARPDAPFDGKTATVVRLEPKTGVPADVYFDRDSGAMLGYTIQPEIPLERVTVHVAAYAEFAPGKRYVSAWRFGESKRLFKVEKFEPNVAVTDADLHPPAPRASWTFAEPHTVPIKVVEHSQLFTNSGARAVHVEASINGHTGQFLLDSGAGGSLISGPFAEKAGLKDIARTGYSGVNGRGVAASLARVASLKIGGSTLHDLIVTRTHGGRTGGEIDGILGFDVLAGALIDVDLPKSTLTIVDPAQHEAQVTKQGAWAFTPDLTTFHIGMPVKVGNNVLSTVWLDTGADFFVILPHELEKKTVALVNEITLSNGATFESFVTFGGVDGVGAERAKCVRLNEIQVGPYRYQKAMSCFAPNDTFGTEGGLVGFDFLRHFNWTFDYPHNRVILTPNGQ
jgi:predicted aspartyl protease